MAYTLDGITLESKRTPSGIGYFQYGDDNLPTIIYLHGQGERGDGSENSLIRILGQGPLTRKWVNGGYTGWVFKEIFTLGFRILYPQLPTSKNSWDITYIDSFLDDIHTNQPLFLMGWSLGGGGVLRYAAQTTKKHKPTLIAGFASAISPITGENVDCPYFFAHSTNDTVVNVSNTDNYVAKIPNFNSNYYMKGNGGGHYYYLIDGFNTRRLYDRFRSLITTPLPPPPTTYTPGILELGSDGKIYGNFSESRFLII